MARKVTYMDCLVILALLLVWATAVYAGTEGTEFNNLYSTLSGWAKGGLGKVIAIAAFLVGIAAGIARQSLVAIATGIGVAAAVTFTPDVIDELVTALL